MWKFLALVFTFLSLAVGYNLGYLTLTQVYWIGGAVVGLWLLGVVLALGLVGVAMWLTHKDGKL